MFRYILLLAITITSVSMGWIVKAESNSYQDIELERRIAYLEEQAGRTEGKIEELSHALKVLQSAVASSAAASKSSSNNIIPTADNMTIVPALLPTGDAAQADKPQPQIKADHLLPEGPAQVQYEQAMALLHKAQYSAAEQAFKNFMKHHPKHALNVNAKYWLGETYLIQNRFAESAVMFAEVYQTFHQQSQSGASKDKIKQSRAKAPEALLKLVFALKGMKKDQDACATLAQLDQEFPQLPQNLIKLAEKARIGLRCR